MVDQGRSEFYVVLTISLCVLESKTNVNKFVILHYTVLILRTENLGSYMRLTCEYELDILSNTNVSLAKDHGENYMKLRPFPARHLLRNHLFLKISK